MADVVIEHADPPPDITGAMTPTDSTNTIVYFVLLLAAWLLICRIIGAAWDWLRPTPVRRAARRRVQAGHTQRKTE